MFIWEISSHGQNRKHISPVRQARPTALLPLLSRGNESADPGSRAGPAAPPGQGRWEDRLSVEAGSTQKALVLDDTRAFLIPQ